MPPIQKFETDSTRMVEGLVELLDDIGDLAINRLVLHSRLLPGGFDPQILGQGAIDKFKVGWFAALGELMFVGLAKEPKFEEFREKFLAELRYSAGERGIAEFCETFRGEIQTAIGADRDFQEHGIFARPAVPNSPEPARSVGLGPTLAAMIGTASFDAVGGIDPIRERMDATLEAEFNNAYGHCATACARFTMV